LYSGKLYTILTNKSAKGKQGSLIAMIRGTKSEEVIRHLMLLLRSKRLKVKEITLDLSPTMMLIAKKCFPYATQVSDRFHVQRLMNEAVNDLRISHRWQAIDLENKEIELAKETGHKYIPHIFRNEDTRSQLLARSRYIIMKNRSKWTRNQEIRAEILFEEYPDIEEAYKVSLELTQLYNKKITKESALTKLAHWYNKVEKLDLKYFRGVIETMKSS
jgi:transposase